MPLHLLPLHEAREEARQGVSAVALLALFLPLLLQPAGELDLGHVALVHLERAGAPARAADRDELATALRGEGKEGKVDGEGMVR